MTARRSTRWPGSRSAVVPHGGGADGGRSVGDQAELADRNGAAAEHLAAGRPDRAVIALERLLDDCRRLLGGEHPATLVVEGNLAVAFVMGGRDEAGVHLMIDNLHRRERVFGDEHARTLAARDAVATTHRLAGRLSEALWLYSRVAPQRNRVLGPSHPDTLTTRLGLGLTFAAAGDTAMARDVVMAALQDCDRSGVEHAEMLRSCLADLHRADTARSPATGTADVPRQRRASAAVVDGGVTRPRGRVGPSTIDIGSRAGRGDAP
ncbi:tetratricopeptide repeat protein [Pseudonocardia sp.]|uniref:tetratricopeptide repeat protein n=1 Tax=Pseudonocardia sp. TaxID=60912 RepID=UPI002638FFBF|nr:tetratricopeptide repeat protein [Pseudonocardia sp.]